MRGKLSKVLAHLQQEKEALQQQLEACLEDEDYKMAHRYRKAVTQLNLQLNALHNLADPLYDQKQWHAGVIQRLKHWMAEEEQEGDSETWRQTYGAEQLQAEEKQLAELEAASASYSPQPDTTHLQEALHKLAERRISSFTLFFGADTEPRCIVKLVRKTLLITLPDIQRHMADYVIRKRQLRQLRRLGFRFYDSKNILLLVLPCFEQQEVAVVKPIIMKLYFDVFFRSFTGQACIKYRELPPAVS